MSKSTKYEIPGGWEDFKEDIAEIVERYGYYGFMMCVASHSDEESSDYSFFWEGINEGLVESMLEAIDDEIEF